MKQFNNWEKELLKKISAIKPSEQVSIDKWLGQNYIREEDGRALIIQAKAQFAVFFLIPSIFDDKEKKGEEIKKFLEFISLISFLKEKGYISTYRGLMTKRREMFFIQDHFIEHLPTGENIILNAKGDYTSGPDTIHDKNKNIVYKGEYFDMDPFEKILNATTGVMHVSESINDLVQEINKPKDVDNTSPSADTKTDQSQEEVLSAEKTENKKSEVKTLAAEIPNHQHDGPTKPTPSTRQKPEKAKRNVLQIIVNILFFIILLAIAGMSYLKFRAYDQKSAVFSNKQKDLHHELANMTDKYNKLVKFYYLLVDSLSADKRLINDLEETRAYYGIDVSNWNGEIVCKIGENDSLTFVICKATDGVNYVDPEFKHNWLTIKDKGLIRGAYHFFRVDDKPIKQADFYLSTVKKFDSADMAPIVDIERASLPFGSGVNKVSLQENLLIFLKHIESRCNKIPIIYTNLAFANEFLTLDSLADYPLWLAEYTGGTSPILPKLWKEKGCKIWQKSASYSVNSKKTDLDVFYGKKKDL